MTQKSRIVASIITTIYLAVSFQAFGQQTTSSLSGTLSDQSGVRVTDAEIAIVHLPTGSATRISPDGNGRFFASGLRPGGPYTIRITSDIFQAYEIQNVQLGLDQVSNIAIQLTSAEAVELSEFVVSASDAGISSIDSGVASIFSSRKISSFPTTTRDPKEIVRLDPRALVIEGGGGQLSIAGVNQRYNSITIDGIRMNDDFGLNRTGNPGRANPVSIDAIEQIVVKVAEYDVEASQYLGGNINMVTKSGTNDFHGSVYYFFKDAGLAGDLPNGSEPILEDETYGFTLGGPILKDRLFFFANYEKFTTSTPINFTPDDANISDSDITEFQNILQDVYGFDGGGVQLINPTDDKRLLIKLDANLAEGHRAVITYSTDEARTSNQEESNNSNFALSSTYLTRDRDIKGYSAQLFSDWTDKLSTEVIYSYKKAVEDRNPSNTEFAQFIVGTDSGSRLHAGPRFPFQQNFQFNIYETFKAKATYNLADHILKGGYDYQKTKINNDFILFAPNGYYVFDDFTALANRTASAFMYENAPSGNPEEAGARWAYNVHNFFLQDHWQVSEDVALDFGFRSESYSSGSFPAENSGFVQRNQFSNSENLDGKSIFMPRLGLTWNPTDRTTVRTGFGLFSGGTPNVFYSNTYNRNGVSTATVGVFSRPCANLGPDADAICNDVDGFNVAPEAQALVAQNVGSGTAEALDPNFEIPSSWKYSISVEHRFDFSNVGLGDDWYIKADVLHIKAKDALTIDVLGLTQSGITFDGRPSFDAGTRDFILTNTSKGESTSFSISFEKSFENGWDVFGSYTYTDSKDVDSMLGSVLSDSTRAVATDINNLPLTTSTFEIEDRLILGVNYSREFAKNYFTNIGVFAEHRSGLPFSYRFANNPFNSQATAPFYLPLQNDPNVSYGEGTESALNSFITENGLEGYRGQVLPRNEFQSKDVNKIDLRFVQELPTPIDGAKLEFIFDVDNLTNLIDSDWGIERTVDSGGTFGGGGNAIPLASVEYDPVSNSYTYSGRPAAPANDDSRIVDSIAFWSIQTGFRFSF